jgi:hypothetical protein
MSVFALLLCIIVASMERFEVGSPTLALLLPFGITFAVASPAYHEGYHYLTKWQWYEWLGIGGPLVILWWLGRIARARQQAKLDLLCRALIPYELICAGAARTLSIPAQFEKPESNLCEACIFYTSF